MSKIAAAAVALSLSSAAAAENIEVSANGSTPTFSGSAEQFSGRVLVDGLNTPQSARFSGSAIVNFAPGARTAWHTHPAGQWFFVTAGQGWVQEAGQARKTVKAGDTVWIAANVKHWHGATDKTAMSHLVITPLHEGKNVTWLELVADADYAQH